MDFLSAYEGMCAQVKSRAIWRPRDMFPLGIPASQPIAKPSELSKDCRPFGLRYLMDPDPGANCDLDLANLRFDNIAQIAMVIGESGLAPVFKHTSGQTSTTTNVQDRKTSDSDTDYEQDK